MRISATRFAGKLPRLIIDERRRTSLRVNVASPALTFDGFGMEAAAGPDAVVRLASAVLALQRAEVDVNDGTTAMEVAVQAGTTAPDLSVVMVPQTGTEGAQGQITGLDLDLRRVSYRREETRTGWACRAASACGRCRATCRLSGRARRRIALRSPG